MSDLIEMMKGKDLFRSYSRRTLVVANLCQGPPSTLVLSLLALLQDIATFVSSNRQVRAVSRSIEDTRCQ